MQTVSDYPLVEAIHQDVVKHPVLPDAPSRVRLQEHKSAIFTERDADYLLLGIEEWRKSYAEHETLGKKAVLFVMVDDTRNCDEAGAYLEKTCPELQGAVLIIHTKNNGEISESPSGKNKEELERLRKQANAIDSRANPYTKEVVSLIESGLGVRRSESELPPPVELKGGPETRDETEAVLRSGPGAGIAEPARERSEAWQAYFRKLQRRPDGSYYNPDGIDDEAFFEELERFRAESRFTPRDQ